MKRSVPTFYLPVPCLHVEQCYEDDADDSSTGEQKNNLTRTIKSGHSDDRQYCPTNTWHSLNRTASNSKPSSYCHQLSLLTEHIMSLPFSSLVRPQMSVLFLLTYSGVFIKLKSRGTRNLLHGNLHTPSVAWAQPQDQSVTKQTVVH